MFYSCPRLDQDVCGASAAEEVLKREKSDRLTVFVVWEPILASDWSRPDSPGSRSHLRSTSHAVLGQGSFDRQTIRPAAINCATQPVAVTQACCGIWSPLSRGVQWGSSQPVFVDGPVAKVDAALARRLAEYTPMKTASNESCLLA